MRLFELGVGPGAVGVLGDVFADFGFRIAKVLSAKPYTSADAVYDDMIKGFNQSLQAEQTKLDDNPAEYKKHNSRYINKNTGDLNKGYLLKSFLYNFMKAKHGDLPETQVVLKKFDKNQAFVNGEPNRPYIKSAMKKLAQIFVDKIRIK